MVSKNSVNPGVVSPEVSSGDFWMKFLDEDEIAKEVVKEWIHNIVIQLIAITVQK